MQWERVDESIKVRADFQSGSVSPVMFRRGHHLVKVRSVNTRWQESKGRYRRCYFSVTSDVGDGYQLSFDTGELVWRLDSIMLDG